MAAPAVMQLRYQDSFDTNGTNELNIHRQNSVGIPPPVEPKLVIHDLDVVTVENFEEKFNSTHSQNSLDNFDAENSSLSTSFSFDPNELKAEMKRVKKTQSKRFITRKRKMVHRDHIYDKSNLIRDNNNGTDDDGDDDDDDDDDDGDSNSYNDDKDGDDDDGDTNDDKSADHKSNTKKSNSKAMSDTSDWGDRILGRGTFKALIGLVQERIDIIGADLGEHNRATFMMVITHELHERWPELKPRIMPMLSAKQNHECQLRLIECVLDLIVNIYGKFESKMMRLCANGVFNVAANASRVRSMLRVKLCRRLDIPMFRREISEQLLAGYTYREERVIVDTTLNAEIKKIVQTLEQVKPFDARQINLLRQRYEAHERSIMTRKAERDLQDTISRDLSSAGSSSETLHPCTKTGRHVDSLHVTMLDEIRSKYRVPLRSVSLNGGSRIGSVSSLDGVKSDYIEDENMLTPPLRETNHCVLPEGGMQNVLLHRNHYSFSLNDLSLLKQPEFPAEPSKPRSDAPFRRHMRPYPLRKIASVQVLQSSRYASSEDGKDLEIDHSKTAHGIEDVHDFRSDAANDLALLAHQERNGSSSRYLKSRLSTLSSQQPLSSVPELTIAALEEEEDLELDLHPLLQAMTPQTSNDFSLRKAAQGRDITAVMMRPRGRAMYLDSSKLVPENVVRREEVTAAINRMKKGTIDQYFSSRLPTGFEMRMCASTVSGRIPKSILTLRLEPPIMASELRGDVDESVLHEMDINIHQSRQVRELYREILQDDRKAHLQFYDDVKMDSNPSSINDFDFMSITSACRPVCKELFRPYNPYPRLILSYDTDDDRDAVAAAPPLPQRLLVPPSNVQQRVYTDTSVYNPSLSLLWRTNKINEPVNVAESATAQGGHQTAVVNEEKYKRGTRTYSTDTYMAWLGSCYTDFLGLIFDILPWEDADNQNDQRPDATVVTQTIEQQEQLALLERDLREKKKKFKAGQWNANVVMIGGLGKYPSLMKPQDLEQEPELGPEDEETPNQGEKEPIDNVDVRIEDDAKADDTVASEDDLQKSLQKRLEIIWMRLKLTPQLRIDMAIKYSSETYSSLLETAIILWEEVTTAILVRERLLGHCEMFEREAGMKSLRNTSPKHLSFRSGKRSSLESDSVPEANELQMNLLKSEALLIEFLGNIKCKLGDTVYFRDRPYAEKMKTDYLEMLYWLQRDRKDYRREVSGPGVYGCTLSSLAEPASDSFLGSTAQLEDISDAHDHTSSVPPLSSLAVPPTLSPSRSITRLAKK